MKVAIKPENAPRPFFILRGGMEAFFFGLLVVAVWMQAACIILPVKDFNWLAYLDSDLIYQVERFLRVVGFPGIAEINSSVADYGSEFFLLSPPFTFFTTVFGIKDPVFAYFFLSGVHLLSGAVALLLLGGMLRRQFQSRIAPVLFLMVCLSSNLFFQYLAFLKPDANVVLLCLVVSLYGLEVFLEADRPAGFVLALVAAGLGTAVKWWGAFMVFPSAYALYQGRGRPASAVFLGRAPRYFLWGLLVLLLLVFLGSDTNIKLYHYVLEILSGRQPLSAGRIRALLDPANVAGLSRGPAVWGLVAVLCLGCAFVSRFALQPARVRRLFSGPIRAGAFLLGLSGLGLIVFTLLFDLPFLLGAQFYYSVKRYSHFFIALNTGNASQTSLAGGILANTTDWWRAALADGFFSLILIPLLVLAVFLTTGRSLEKRRARQLRTTLLFLAPILAALFFFVTKQNGATEAMLLPLLMYFVFCACLAFLEHFSPKKTAHLVAAILLAPCFGQIGINLITRPNVVDTCASRQGLAREVAQLNAALAVALDQTPRRVYFLNRDFPLSHQPPSWRIVKYDPLDAPLAPLVATMRPGDRLVVSTRTLPPEAQAAGLREVATLSGRRFERDGTVTAGPLFVVLEAPASDNTPEGDSE